MALGGKSPGVLSLISSVSIRPIAFKRDTGSGLAARRSAAVRFGFGRMESVARSSEKLRRVSRLTESLGCHLAACRVASLHAKIAVVVFQIELCFTFNHADNALQAHIGSQKRPAQGSKNSPSRRSTSS